MFATSATAFWDTRRLTSNVLTPWLRLVMVPVAPGATTGNTSMTTVTPAGGFTGNVAMTAVLTSIPSGAQDLPTLSFGATSPVAITGTSAGTATLTVSTTPATSSGFVHPARTRGSETNSGGATLAFALLIGMDICVAVRGRESWTRFVTLVLVAALTGAFFSCGSDGTNTRNSGTTPGKYAVTVTGTSGNTTATSTLTITVQ
jgi:trimeric autotransporter adhesin